MPGPLIDFMVGTASCPPRLKGLRGTTCGSGPKSFGGTIYTFLCHICFNVGLNSIHVWSLVTRCSNRQTKAYSYFMSLLNSTFSTKTRLSYFLSKRKTIIRGLLNSILIYNIQFQSKLLFIKKIWLEINNINIIKNK